MKFIKFILLFYPLIGFSFEGNAQEDTTSCISLFDSLFSKAKIQQVSSRYKHTIKYRDISKPSVYIEDNYVYNGFYLQENQYYTLCWDNKEAYSINDEEKEVLKLQYPEGYSAYAEQLKNPYLIFNYYEIGGCKYTGEEYLKFYFQSKEDKQPIQKISQVVKLDNQQVLKVTYWYSKYQEIEYKTVEFVSELANEKGISAKSAKEYLFNGNNLIDEYSNYSFYDAENDDF